MAHSKQVFTPIPPVLLLSFSRSHQLKYTFLSLLVHLKTITQPNLKDIKRYLHKYCHLSRLIDQKSVFNHSTSSLHKSCQNRHRSGHNRISFHEPINHNRVYYPQLILLLWMDMMRINSYIFLQKVLI